MYKKAFELSYKNKKVEIEIQDFVGDVRNINGTEDLFSLSYISDSKDKGQSILVTEADINFYADDYFNIDELKTVGETDIKVKYYEDDSLLWSGFVIPDFFSTSVDIAPVVSMVATDRIGTLKEISNNAESNIPIQILASCLKQTGQDLPINLIADNNHFETPIQLERIDEIASYDVIRTFMVLFNCKITLYKNAWWIINKKLLESGFVNYKSYNSDGVGGSVTPFAQPILDIDLVDRGGQREIKPTASEISLFLEFGGAKRYPSNWDFNEWSSNKLNNWTAYNGFIQNKNSKIPLRYDSNYSLIYGQDTNINSLLSRNPFFSTLTDTNYINSPHIRSEEVPMQFIKGVSEVTFKIDFSSINDDSFAIYAVLLIKIPNKNPLYHDYVAIGHDGNIVRAGTTNIDLTKVPAMRIQPAVDENQDRLTAIRTTIESKFKISASDDLDLARSANAKIQIILFGAEYIDGENTSLIDVVFHSANISFNDYEVTGKGLIFKIKQGGEKFSKSREAETILFSDKINQGVNGHFYNYKYDDTSIVDLPSEFALSSVRERADMFSKARDYYSLDGDFIVNPLAKYVCGSKSFVLIGGENRREDAGIIVEEIVSNTLNRTDFIYTYFDDGKDKVKSIGTASGGSSSGGGGGVSTPQLWKVDEEGNIYTEYNAYSLKELSAFGLGEEQGGGGGAIINVIDSLTSTSKTDALSANMGMHLKTLIDNIEVGEGGQVIVDWEAITGKPDTFAPSAHTHPISDITNLQNTLDSKQATLTTHSSQINIHSSQIDTHSSQIQDIVTSYIDNKGYFATLTSLQASYPTPEIGDTAYVANALSSTGYYIYNVVGGIWTSSTVEAPPVTVPINDYTLNGGSTKTLKEVDDNLVQLAGDVIHKSIGKNKLNLESENFLEGRYLNLAADIKSNATYCVTDFIEINSGQSFIKNGYTNTAIYTAYYDANFVYIPGSAFSNSNLIPYYPGAKYFRATIYANQKTTVQIELGTEPTEFSGYTEFFDTVSNDSLKDNSVTESKLAALSVSTEKINFGAVTEAKTNFLIPTRNLFNKDAEDVTYDRYVSWTSGGLSVNSTYNATGFIPIVPGQTYTRSYVHQTAFYNLNKQYVSGLDMRSSPTFVAPENCYFVRCTVAKTAWDTFQLEEGGESTGYVPYGYYLPEKYLPAITPVKTFPNDIVTPKKQYLLSNYENTIYFKSIARRWRPDYEFVRIEGGEWSNMKTLARITNPTIETATVNARIYDLDFEAIASDTFAVHIGNIATDNGHIKGIYIGDSLAYNGGYILKVNALLPNISWDGIRKSYSGEIYGEGRGGWRLASYFGNIHSSATDSFTPFMHPIDPYKYYGGTAFWAAVVNGGSEYGNNGFIAKATEIGFNSVTGLLTTPATNDCMWNDANGRYERWNGSAWVEITEATLNFSFNFAKYRSTWLVDQPDIVTIMLGTNDFRSQANEAAIDSFWATWKSRMDIFCASVIADNPSAKIAILLPPTSCGSMDNTGGAFTLKQTAMMWYGRKKIITDFDDRESEGIYLVDVGRSVDPNYGFDEIYQTPFSDYTGTEKRYVQSNTPHPGANGYYQLGVPLAGWIQKVR